MDSGDTSGSLTHERMLGNGHWVVDKVIYSSREAKVVPVLVAVSVVSLVAVVGLLVVLVVAAWETRKSEVKNYFFRTNVAVYFMWLLLSDVMQAVGSIMNARWFTMGAVTTGEFCTAQGVIKHIADISSGGWSLVIAIHTFTVLFCQVQPPRWVMWLTVALVNGYLCLMCFLGPLVYDTAKYGNGEFYGISGYWCWISDEYTVGQITMDYLAMFTSAIFSFFFYVLVFLRMRGNIVVVGRYVSWRWKTDDDWRGRSVDDRALGVAKQMLLYPIAYTFVILPIACARFAQWTGHTVPFGVTIFCDTVFLLSGVVNVILFSFTRRTSHALPSRQTLSSIMSAKRFHKSNSSGDSTFVPSETIATFGNVDASLLPDEKRLSTDSIGGVPRSASSPVTFSPISYGTVMTPAKNQFPSFPSPGILTPPPAMTRRPPGTRQVHGAAIERKRIQRKPPPPLSIASIPEADAVPESGMRHPAGPRAMKRPFSPPGATPPLSRLHFLAKLSPSKMLSGFLLQGSPSQDEIPEVPALPRQPRDSEMTLHEMEDKDRWRDSDLPT